MLRLNNGETNKRLPRAARGFTLIELMIVMGVIIILVAMMFPVIIGARAKARNKQALTEAHNIVLALKGYRMEFGKWPNQTQAADDTTYFTNNHLVIAPLIGNNPRGKVFLAIQLLSTNISGGLTNLTGQTDSITNLVDPWGVPYVIGLDENMDGSTLINISNVPYANMFATPSAPYYYLAGATTNTRYTVANVEVAVASFAGKTNILTFEVETWSDPR